MPIGIQEKHERDSFDEFLDTLKEDREVIHEPVIPEPEHLSSPSDSLPYIENPVSEVPDPVLEEKKLKVAQIPAKTIVDVIDTTAISLNSYIAMEPQEGATNQEKESLQDAVANYLRDTDIDISPGKLVLVLVLMIYGPKTMQAFQTRKENQANAALRARVVQLEDQLREKEAANGTVPSV